MKREEQKVDRRYHLVPRTLCFVFHDEDVLLLRGAPTKRLWANLYNGIGGHVMEGEDVASAARREIREESGLEVDGLRLEGVVTIEVEAQLGIGLYVFSARTSQREVIPSAEGGVTWFPKDALPEEGLMDDLPTLLGRVRSASATDPPFCAHYSYGADNELLIRFGEG